MKRAQVQRYLTDFYAEKENEKTLETFASEALKNGDMVRFWRDGWGNARVEIVRLEPINEYELAAISMIYKISVGKPNQKVKV